MVYFAIYRVSITETQCVNNKVMPLQCNAKCQLEEYMQKDMIPLGDKHSNAKSLSDFDIFLIDTNRRNLTPENVLPFHLIASKSVFIYKGFLSKIFNADIFHPPSVPTV